MSISYVFRKNNFVPKEMFILTIPTKRLGYDKAVNVKQKGNCVMRYLSEILSCVLFLIDVFNKLNKNDYLTVYEVHQQ